jgi:hypothetical protein
MFLRDHSIAPSRFSKIFHGLPDASYTGSRYGIMIQRPSILDGMTRAVETARMVRMCGLRTSISFELNYQDVDVQADPHSPMRPVTAAREGLGDIDADDVPLGNGFPGFLRDQTSRIRRNRFPFRR